MARLDQVGLSGQVRPGSLKHFIFTLDICIHTLPGDIDSHITRIFLLYCDKLVYLEYCSIMLKGRKFGFYLWQYIPVSIINGYYLNFCEGLDIGRPQNKQVNQTY